MNSCQQGHMYLVSQLSSIAFRFPENVSYTAKFYFPGFLHSSTVWILNCFIILSALLLLPSDSLTHPHITPPHIHDVTALRLLPPRLPHITTSQKVDMQDWAKGNNEEEAEGQLDRRSSNPLSNSSSLPSMLSRQCLYFLCPPSSTTRQLSTGLQLSKAPSIIHTFWLFHGSCDRLTEALIFLLVYVSAFSVHQRHDAMDGWMEWVGHVLLLAVFPILPRFCSKHHVVNLLPPCIPCT